MSEARSPELGLTSCADPPCSAISPAAAPTATTDLRVVAEGSAEVAELGLTSCATSPEFSAWPRRRRRFGGTRRCGGDGRESEARSRSCPGPAGDPATSIVLITSLRWCLSHPDEPRPPRSRPSSSAPQRRGAPRPALRRRCRGGFGECRAARRGLCLSATRRRAGPGRRDLAELAWPPTTARDQGGLSSAIPAATD